MNDSIVADREDLSTSALFTSRELSRLDSYRAAVSAGFYTDNCLETTHADLDWIESALHNTGAKEGIV